MGPVRGTLFLFPYGFLAFWLGWCWFQKRLGIEFYYWSHYWDIWFFSRVVALSTLVGDNLWILITRASWG